MTFRAKLTLRIHKYLKHSVNERKYRTQEHEVELFHLLSEPLKWELHLAIIAPRLRVHPFLSRYALVSMQAMRNVCNVAASRMSLSVGDAICDVGQLAKHFYLVVSGRLIYEQQAVGDGLGSVDIGERNSLEIIEDGKIVFEKEWLCEMVLWLSRWHHCGTISADSHCQIIAVDAELFRRVTAQHSLGLSLARNYALSFIEALKKHEGPMTDFLENFDVYAQTATLEKSITARFRDSRRELVPLMRQRSRLFCNLFASCMHHRSRR